MLAALVLAGCGAKHGAVTLDDGLPSFNDPPTTMLIPDGSLAKIDCTGNISACLADPALESDELTTETVFDMAVRALVALGPHYQDYFKQSLFYISRFPEQPLGRNAYAYFNSVSGHTVINDFQKWRLQDKARHAALVADLPPNLKPSLGLYRVVQMMAMLSNEYTHWRHYKNGVVRAWLDSGNTEEGCSVYARMQHASDLMTLDMLTRLFDISLKRKDAKLGYAAIGGARTLLGDAGSIQWVEAVQKNDLIALRKVIQAMSRWRLKPNNDTQDCKSDETDVLPWIKTPLPRYIIQAIDEPLTQTYQALQYRAP